MSRAGFAALVAFGLAVLIAVDGAVPLLLRQRPMLRDVPFLIALVLAGIALPLWRRHSWARISGLVIGLLGMVTGVLWLTDAMGDSGAGFWAQSYPGARFIEIAEWLGMSSLVVALIRPLASNNRWRGP
jgi:hypothetical protein